MDNWLIEVIKIILGALVGVLLADAFPTIKSFLKKGSVSLRNVNIRIVISKYKEAKEYKENQASLAVMGVYRLTRVFFHSLILFMLVIFDIKSIIRGEPEKSFSLYNTPYIGIYVGVILSMLSGFIDTVNRVNRFDKFREETIAELKKLGGNPEDLDKEVG